MRRRKISVPWKKMHQLPSYGNQLSPKDLITSGEMRPRSRTVNDFQEPRESRSQGNSPKLPVKSSSFLTGPVFVRKVDKERIHNYKTFRVLILGVSNVGKTSILERFVNGCFTDDYTPSISQTYETGLFLELDNKLKQFDLEFHDFNGELKQHYTELYRNEIAESDGIIVVHTKHEIESFATALEMITDIKNIKKPLKASILVMENKSDDKSHFDDIRGTRRSFELEGVLTYEVSAKTNSMLSEAIAMLVRNMENETNTTKS